MLRTAALLIALIAAQPTAAGPPTPGPTAARYDVRLAGIKLGEMTLAGRVDGGAYVAHSAFSTSGIAGALARAAFNLKSRGQVRGGRFRPASYDEAIDTGSRKSSARLRYRGGVPRIAGGTLADDAPDPGDVPVDPATQGGTLDPLTAMFAALHDQPRETLCRTDVVIFDGARRSRIRTTSRAEAGAEVVCTGAYTRLAGFTASELKRQRVYPFTIRFAPGADGLMEARRLTVQSRYGAAELVRR